MDTCIASWVDGELIVEPLQQIKLTRWLKETSSSKYLWYPFCKVYDFMGSLGPDWAVQLATNIQKTVVSVSD